MLKGSKGGSRETSWEAATWPRQEMTVAWTWVLAAGVAGSEMSYYGYIEGEANKI